MIDLLVKLIGPFLKVSAAPPPVPEGATDVQLFRASPRYLSYRYLLTTLTFLPVLLPWVLGCAALLVTNHHGKIPMWVLTTMAVVYGWFALSSFALALVSARLDYEFHCYVTTDRSLRIRHGIWEQLEATLTYANAQNVRVTQGPLERYFNIASVVIDTAGGSSKPKEGGEPRGILHGIENANALRNQIMQKMRASKSTGLGDPDDQRDHATALVHGEDLVDLELLRSIRDEVRGLVVDAASKDEHAVH